MKLPEGWYWADEEEAKRLSRELSLEMIPSHFLYEKEIEVIAHPDGANDDILVRHTYVENTYTVVHLTWSMKPEINDKHPTVEFHGTFEEFMGWEDRYLGL